MNPPNPAFAWKPLVVSPAPERARTLRAALMELGLAGVQVTEYPRAGTLAALVAQNGCNVCFLDVAADPERALALVGEGGASLPVVALHPPNDADAILRALRRGASEFLSEASSASVRAVLDRLVEARAPQAGKHSGRLWCVIPGKAGCGASTLAAHLALERGRSGGARVLLIDTDPLSASIGFLLNLKSEFHFGDVLRDARRMDDDLWQRLTVSSGGIDVLAAPENPAARCDAAGEAAAGLAAFLRQRYDTIVVDTTDARAAVEGGFASLGDDVLLVTTRELAVLHATRRAIRCLEQTVRDRSHLRLVINRYTAVTRLSREDVRQGLEMNPFATLSNDYEVLQRALIEGRPAPADSRYAASVRALCRALLGEAPAAPGRGRWWPWGVRK
jgi:pilus assembly protein CpaE